MYLALLLLLAADVPDRAQLTALSRTFLRDSAELRMDVVTKTVVTDAKGKKKRNAQSNVGFIFHGYNAGTQRFSFRSTAGLMSRRIMFDSFAGNFAAVNAFTRLSEEAVVEPGGGDSFLVRTRPEADCKGFTMSPNFLYGHHYCYATLHRVTRDASGKLAVREFAVDIEQLPAAGKVRYLGDAQIRKLHSDGEVQEATLADDPRPFLIPKRVTTTIETDLGTVVVTNEYALHKETRR